MPRTKRDNVSLSKAEIRHNKQKEKLVGKTNIEEAKQGYVPQKTLKMQTYEVMKNEGFHCAIINAVLMFSIKDENAVKVYFSKHFDKVPFSYGFTREGDLNVTE